MASAYLVVGLSLYIVLLLCACVLLFYTVQNAAEKLTSAACLFQMGLITFAVFRSSWVVCILFQEAWPDDYNNSVDFVVNRLGEKPFFCFLTTVFLLCSAVCLY